MCHHEQFTFLASCRVCVTKVGKARRLRLICNKISLYGIQVYGGVKRNSNEEKGRLIPKIRKAVQVDLCTIPVRFSCCICTQYCLNAAGAS